MPYLADTRCGDYTIELNCNSICGLIEEITETNYTEDIKEGSRFWMYVYSLEEAINNDLVDLDGMKDTRIWQYIEENYNEIAAWLNVKEFFVKEEEEEDCECGRNIHKGLVKGQMRCKYCDIDGDNYNGGLTSDEEGV